MINEPLNSEKKKRNRKRCCRSRCDLSYVRRVVPIGSPKLESVGYPWNNASSNLPRIPQSRSLVTQMTRRHLDAEENSEVNAAAFRASLRLGCDRWITNDCFSNFHSGRLFSRDTAPAPWGIIEVTTCNPVTDFIFSLGIVARQCDSH